jgi:TonB family protein
MSVEAHESMSDSWTRWQGHLINGVFPLGRYLGCSDHSGVFVTRSVGRAPAEVAVKLVPANRAVAESLLPRWKRAGGLPHPHLIRLLEWGGCRLDGLPYLYLVMEYADQTLAQLLQGRALTGEEAREMLPPILDALAFLHGRNQLQGQVKPANILVVGDQLKLASDTIRHVTEGPIRYVSEGTIAMSADALSVYDPPEALHGSNATAGDVWALGVSLFEALTRRTPSGFGEPRDAAALPADLAPALREVVTRCLNRRPQDRPRVAELVALVRGESPGAVAAATVRSPPSIPQGKPADRRTPEPKAPDPKAADPKVSDLKASDLKASDLKASDPKAPDPKAPDPKAPDLKASDLKASDLNVPDLKATDIAIREPVSQRIAPPRVPSEASQSEPAEPEPAEPAMAQAPSPQSLLAVVLGALVILAVGWIGVRAFRAHHTPAAGAPLVQTTGGTPLALRGAGAPATADARAAARAVSTTKAVGSGVARSASALHEVIPDVPWSARRTIRGHIKVWVRVIVDQDGSVFAAVLDRSGPSRYFQRLALEAAKKWTFPSVSTPPRRLLQIRFDFGRDGTTGSAIALR